MILDPIARTVLNLMKIKGGVSYLQIKTAAVYNPATSTTTPGTTEEYEVRTIALDYYPKFAGETTNDGTLIKAGDKQIFMRPDGYPKPKRGDTVLHADQRFTIVTVKDFNPSGANSYLYEIFARL